MNRIIYENKGLISTGDISIDILTVDIPLNTVGFFRVIGRLYLQSLDNELWYFEDNTGYLKRSSGSLSIGSTYNVSFFKTGTNLLHSFSYIDSFDNLIYRILRNASAYDAEYHIEIQHFYKEISFTL